MTTWVRHTWILDGSYDDDLGVAYAELGSVGDTQLEDRFESTREIAVEIEPASSELRLMKGWIRFG